MVCGLWCAIFMATTVAAISGSWFAIGLGKTFSMHWRMIYGFGFGAVVGTAQFASIVTAVVTGAAAPLVFKRMGADPATLAGPLETTVQDVLGYGTLTVPLEPYLPTMILYRNVHGTRALFASICCPT